MKKAKQEELVVIIKVKEKWGCQGPWVDLLELGEGSV